MYISGAQLLISTLKTSKSLFLNSGFTDFPHYGSAKETFFLNNNEANFSPFFA